MTDNFYCLQVEAGRGRPRCRIQCYDCAQRASSISEIPQAEDTTEELVVPERRRMPTERKSITHKAKVAGFSFYITAGMYEDGTVGEVFVRGLGKEGSTIQGLLDGYATSLSINLQYGAPLDVLARKFAHMRFEPFGETANPEIPYAFSLLDYVIRWLALKFGSAQLRADLDRICAEMRQRVAA